MFPQRISSTRANSSLTTHTRETSGSQHSSFGKILNYLARKLMPSCVGGVNTNRESEEVRQQNCSALIEQPNINLTPDARTNLTPDVRTDLTPDLTCALTEKLDLDLIKEILGKLNLQDPHSAQKDLAAAALVSKNFRNQALQLFANLEVSVRGLEKVCKILPNLKEIKLRATAQPQHLEYLKEFKLLKKLTLSPFSTSPENLKTIATLLPKLECLDLGDEEVSPGAIAHITQFEALKSLKLNNCRNPDSFNSLDFSKLKNLEYLDLSGCSAITNRHLAQIGQLTELKTLKLASCIQINDTGLTDLSSLGRLEHLDLSMCSQITDKGLLNLGTKENLKNFYLSHLTHSEHQLAITDLGLKYIKNQFPNLKELKLIGGDNFTDAGFVHLGQIESLEKIDLSSCSSITDNDLHHFKNLPKLRSLNLQLCYELTDLGFSNLGKMDSLEDFYFTKLDEGQIDSQESFHIHKQFPNLKKLHLSGWAICDSDLVDLGKLKNLEELDLNNCSATDAGLGHLEPLSKIKTLKLSGVDITDKVFVNLKKMKNLENLGLSCCLKIRGIGFENLKCLDNLKTVELYRIQLDNKGLCELGGLSNLEKLSLSSCSGTRGANSPVDQEGLEFLGKLLNLNSLNLFDFIASDNRSITDLRNLPTFEKLRNLEKLNVGSSSGISRIAINMFLQKLPKLQQISIEEIKTENIEQNFKQHLDKIEFVDNNFFDS